MSLNRQTEERAFRLIIERQSARGRERSAALAGSPLTKIRLEPTVRCSLRRRTTIKIEKTTSWTRSISNVTRFLQVFERSLWERNESKRKETTADRVEGYITRVYLFFFSSPVYFSERIKSDDFYFWDIFSKIWDWSKGRKHDSRLASSRVSLPFPPRSRIFPSARNNR